MTDTAEASADPLQQRVLNAYLALAQVRPSWAGKLILLQSAGEQETAFAFAGIIAGALVLTIDPDTARQRNSLRTGAAHFVVNTVDEALRVLKNEARRGAPLAVGLEADPALEIPALVRRGLLPSLVVSPSQARETQVAKAIADFARMGTLVWPPELAPLTLPRHELRRFQLPNAPARQRFDHELLSILPAEDTIRRRWLEAASRVLPRSRPVVRLCPLTPQESAQLAVVQTSSIPALPR